MGLVGIHYRQHGQGHENSVQKAPAMFTVLRKASARYSMGGPAMQSPSVSVKMRQCYGNAAPRLAQVLLST